MKGALKGRDMTKPPFTQATRAAETLGLTRIEILDLARVGKLAAWVQPDTRIGPDGNALPIVVRTGRLQSNADGNGRKVAMPNGQFLIFDREELSILKGRGWLDLSVLTKENHALLESAYLLPDGMPIELQPGVVLGDGAGNYYEVASWPTLHMMALVGFMTADLDALRNESDESEATEAQPIEDVVMKKRGMIKAHKHHWETIEGDIDMASQNGLSAAKAGERGWYEQKSLAWARAKGKLTTSRAANKSSWHPG